MRYLVLFCLFMTTFFNSFSQELTIKRNQGGLFSFGVRSTMSFFKNSPSVGFGGQVRLQLANRINTEWFGDFTRGNIQNMGNRSDYHVGWSVMYYFTDKVAP
ncbi:MAG: hypothetical protein ABI207_03595, partial [Crocinitomicaceae bacterium]